MPTKSKASTTRLYTRTVRDIVPHTGYHIFVSYRKVIGRNPILDRNRKTTQITNRDATKKYFDLYLYDVFYVYFIIRYSNLNRLSVVFK